MSVNQEGQAKHAHGAGMQWRANMNLERHSIVMQETSKTLYEVPKFDLTMLLG